MISCSRPPSYLSCTAQTRLWCRTSWATDTSLCWSRVLGHIFIGCHRPPSPRWENAHRSAVGPQWRQGPLLLRVTEVCLWSSLSPAGRPFIHSCTSSSLKHTHTRTFWYVTHHFLLNQDILSVTYECCLSRIWYPVDSDQLFVSPEKESPLFPGNTHWLITAQFFLLAWDWWVQASPDSSP